MFDHETVARAIDLSQCGYRLLQWLESALSRGFISSDSAHSYASMPCAMYDWLEEHYENVPDDARPAREDMPEFCNLFSTYLEGSFDLHAAPGQRTFSPQGHCFCPYCSWLVDRPHIRPKKLTARDKACATRQAQKAVLSAAHAEGVNLSTEAVETIVADPPMRECVALCAYAADLLRRLEGHSIGPGQLALWRRFAWEQSGSPKQDFTLTSDLVFDAERELRARVRCVAE